MIGIDIVDLHDPLLQERDARSLQLITHPKDIYPKNEKAFWILWTAKEAVFKCRRAHESFSPKQIFVHITQDQPNTYRYKSENIIGHLSVTHDFVLAYCGEKGLPVYNVYYTKHEANSQYIRAKINEALNSNQLLGLDNSQLPVIMPDEQPISITHHRRYAAYAINA